MKPCSKWIMNLRQQRLRVFRLDGSHLNKPKNARS